MVLARRFTVLFREGGISRGNLQRRIGRKLFGALSNRCGHVSILVNEEWGCSQNNYYSKWSRCVPIERRVFLWCCGCRQLWKLNESQSQVNLTLWCNDDANRRESVVQFGFTLLILGVMRTFRGSQWDQCYWTVSRMSLNEDISNCVVVTNGLKHVSIF